jgi:hypothetical protein
VGAGAAAASPRNRFSGDTLRRLFHDDASRNSFDGRGSHPSQIGVIFTRSTSTEMAAIISPPFFYVDDSALILGDTLISSEGLAAVRKFT